MAGEKTAPAADSKAAEEKKGARYRKDYRDVLLQAMVSDYAKSKGASSDHDLDPAGYHEHSEYGAWYLAECERQEEEREKVAHPLNQKKGEKSVNHHHEGK